MTVLSIKQIISKGLAQQRIPDTKDYTCYCPKPHCTENGKGTVVSRQQSQKARRRSEFMRTGSNGLVKLEHSLRTDYLAVIYWPLRFHYYQGLPPRRKEFLPRSSLLPFRASPKMIPSEGHAH